MIIPLRHDIEQLLRVERLPRTALPIYDRDGGHLTLRVDCLTIDDIRDRLVQRLYNFRRQCRFIRPFTLMRAHEWMANNDLVLRALLVNGSCAPLLRRVARPIWGMQVSIFVHDLVEESDIFGFAEGDYIGVVAYQDGLWGGDFLNQHGIVWGRFRSV